MSQLELVPRRLWVNVWATQPAWWHPAASPAGRDLPALDAQPWHALEVSPGPGVQEDTAAHSASPVWWAGTVYPWQGSRMLGMEGPSCLAESLAREG